MRAASAALMGARHAARSLLTNRPALIFPVPIPCRKFRLASVNHLRASENLEGIMRRADPPPPTSLEGQFLIAMPSLREGPFARSVVYMCAHRDDGAMGIVINQRAEEIDSASSWPSSTSCRKPRRSACRRAPKPCACCAAARSRRDAASSSIRATMASTIRRSRSATLPDRHARHPARDRRGDGPGGGGACARLRRLGLGAARERDPRQRLAHLSGRLRALFSTPISTANMTGRWRSSASTKNAVLRRRPRLRRGAGAPNRSAGTHPLVRFERFQGIRRHFRVGAAKFERRLLPGSASDDRNFRRASPTCATRRSFLRFCGRRRESDQLVRRLAGPI